MRRRLRRFVAYVETPRHQLRLWVTFTVSWMVLTPVTMLTTLAHSVPWLEFMSLFANSASCGTAAVAALAYVRAASADKKASHVIDWHPEIPPIESEVQRGKDE